MPYMIRKAPKKELYWVVNKETKHKYSKDPIPLINAQRQMRLLNAVDHGFVPSKNYRRSRSPSKFKGGEYYPSMKQLESEFNEVMLQSNKTLGQNFYKFCYQLGYDESVPLHIRKKAMQVCELYNKAATSKNGNYSKYISQASDLQHEVTMEWSKWLMHH